MQIFLQQVSALNVPLFIVNYHLAFKQGMKIERGILTLANEIPFVQYTCVTVSSLNGQ